MFCFSRQVLRRRDQWRSGLRQEACQIETRSNDLHSRTAGASREPVREAAIHGGAGETLLGTGTSTYRSSGKGHERKFDVHRTVHCNIIPILKLTGYRGSTVVHTSWCQ